MELNDFFGGDKCGTVTTSESETTTTTTTNTQAPVQVELCENGWLRVHIGLATTERAMYTSSQTGLAQDG